MSNNLKLKLGEEKLSFVMFKLIANLQKERNKEYFYTSWTIFRLFTILITIFTIALD